MIYKMEEEEKEIILKRLVGNNRDYGITKKD